MRILTFRGNYSYKQGKDLTGFVCFCHIETKDTVEGLLSIAQKIVAECRDDKLILVPFAHLHEDAMNKEFAENIFERFCDITKNLTHDEPVSIPFGVTKELHLNVPADDNAVKFFHF